MVPDPVGSGLLFSRHHSWKDFLPVLTISVQNARDEKAIAFVKVRSPLGPAEQYRGLRALVKI